MGLKGWFKSSENKKEFTRNVIIYDEGKVKKFWIRYEIIFYPKEKREVVKGTTEPIQYTTPKEMVIGVVKTPKKEVIEEVNILETSNDAILDTYWGRISEKLIPHILKVGGRPRKFVPNNETLQVEEAKTDSGKIIVPSRYTIRVFKLDKQSLELDLEECKKNIVIDMRPIHERLTPKDIKKLSLKERDEALTEIRTVLLGRKKK